MNEKVFNMKTADVYNALLNKCLRKNKNKEELDEIIIWLTGYSKNQLYELVNSDTSYKDFFLNAKINPASKLIKGKICGIKLEDINNPIYRNIRCLDKMVDELVKNKPISKIIKRIESINDYIYVYDNDYLKEIYLIFKETLNNIDEKISWGMPTFYKKKNIIHFAHNKNHVGIYPGLEVIKLFEDELDESGYKYSKGAIRFPYNKDLPKSLIKSIAIKALEINGKN